MALDNYTDLSTAIGAELSRSDLNSFIPDWITLAESRINNGLRIQQMETVAATVITASGTIALPTNYIELRDAYLTSVVPYQPLERKTPNWIYDHYPYRTADRQPAYIAREAQNFIFGPFPDSQYTVQLVYYNRFASLSTGTNATFLSYPGLWFFGALCESAHKLKADSRIPMWEARFKELMMRVQKESDDEYQSGEALEMQSATPTP